MAIVYTTSSDVSDIQVELLEKYFLADFENRQLLSVAGDIVTHKYEEKAKTIDVPYFERLARRKTALTEDEDVDGVKIESAGKVSLTPKEYGEAITKTKLAQLQTGGQVDFAALELVAGHAADSINGLAADALKSSTNVLVANEVADEGSLTASDTIQDSDLEYVYNRLNRNKVPKSPDGHYVALAHPDITDYIKNLDGFVGIQKYADATVILKGEIGTYKGFRWRITDSLEPNEDSGAGTVDSYDTIFMGFGGFGMAESFPLNLVISGPFDKLGRFVHVGWYSVFEYKITNAKCVWNIKAASGFGDNT